MLAITGRNCLAATLVDDAPLLLDGADGEEPLWPDLLLAGALEAQTSLPDEELHTPGEPEPSINAGVGA